MISVPNFTVMNQLLYAHQGTELVVNAGDFFVVGELVITDATMLISSDQAHLYNEGVRHPIGVPSDKVL